MSACMYWYVLACVLECVSVHVCIYLHDYVYAHVCMCLNECVHVLACIYECMCVHACMCVCVHAQFIASLCSAHSSPQTIVHSVDSLTFL